VVQFSCRSKRPSLSLLLRSAPPTSGEAMKQLPPPMKPSCSPSLLAVSRVSAVRHTTGTLVMGRRSVRDEWVVVVSTIRNSVSVPYLSFGVAEYSYEKQNAYGSVSVHEFGTVCLNLNLYFDQYVTLTPNV
jgi:hypothetical protein